VGGTADAPLGSLNAGENLTVTVPAGLLRVLELREVK
jgi:hypothetical protein